MHKSPVTLEEAYALAEHCYQEGDTQQAEIIFQQILSALPDHIPTANNLAVLMIGRGAFRDAETLLSDFLSRHPDSVDLWNQLGVVRMAFSDHVGAEEAYMEVIRRAPEEAKAHDSLGLARMARSDWPNAAKAFNKAVEHAPNSGRYWSNLGLALHKLHRLDEARAAFRMALERDGGEPEILNRTANLLQEMGQTKEALDLYETAQHKAPDRLDFSINRINLLVEMNQIDEADALLNTLVSRHSDHHDICHAQGRLAQRRGDSSSAVHHFGRAHQLNPDSLSTRNDLGAALVDLGRFDDALSHYNAVLDHNPKHASALANRAVLHLLQGDYQQGWEDYEWRWLTEPFKKIRRSFPYPLWDGSNPAGKKILLITEQGDGDAIQFVRYATQLLKRKARVTVECERQLLSLFRSMGAEISWLERSRHIPSGFDYYAPLMSLPRLLSDEIPHYTEDGAPYLAPSQETMTRWSPRIASTTPTVGLVWAGNPEHRNDHNRSLTLEQLEPLLAVQDIRLFSLQMGSKPAKPAQLKRYNMTDLTEDIASYEDSAAILRQLDLLICVDTSIAHLAGAVGAQAWILLPSPPDWRWGLEGDRTPWYPSLTLFRRPLGDTWDSVINAMVKRITDRNFDTPLIGRYS
ncbi:MAG: tetratricopeptide repeat protein [Magnetococcales bacterium]|nr:tetratricopeptide repeat protein [Magnetococcales bacterium]